MTTSNLGKSLFGFHMDTVHITEKSKISSKTVSKTVSNTACWLGHRSMLVFLYSPRPLARDDTIHSGLGPQTSIIKKIPYRHAHRPI